jgi:hypothetical protein
MPVALPDGALGKQVRCPGCKLVFAAERPAEPLAAAEPVEPTETPAGAITEAAPPAACPTPAPLFDAPPAPAPDVGRRAARSSASPILFVILGLTLVAGLFVLVCAGGVAWWLWRSAEDAAQAIADHRQARKAIIDGPDAKDAVDGIDAKKVLPWIDDRPPPRFFDEPGNPFDQQPKEPAVPKTGKMPSLPAPLPIKRAPLDADTVTRTFPETIHNVVLGGGGRFLLLHLPKLRQVAVFDVNEAKVVKYLAVAGDNVLIAAGMSKLILVFPDTKIIQRWNLLTHERELTGTVPLGDAIAGIGMGYGCDGPLVVQTVREPSSGEDHFLDIRSMQLIDLREKIVGHVHRGAGAQMRGSQDGRTLGVHSGGQHPYLLTIGSDAALIQGADPSGVIPGPDGKTIFGMGLFSPELKRLGSSPPNNTFCVPALTGPFYLAIPAGTFHPGIPAERKTGGIELRLVGDNRPLLTLPEIENAMRDAFNLNRAALSIDQRYHFIPAAKLLITIPSTPDRLVLHKLDVDDALEKSGIDYLYVASTPPPFAVLGRDYTYPIAVKSKKGGLKYRVEAGPDGMKVAADGKLTWKVPAGFRDRHIDVILTIGDSTGQETFHTFRLAVVDAPPGEGRDGAQK